jgi:thiosulfate reductase cytochrome b subunit
MYLYPKWIRLWHMLNVLLFLVLIITGISLEYTGRNNPSYMVGFAKAVKWHNFAAILLTANYIFFVLGNRITRNSRYYKIKRENFWSDINKQLKFYSFGMFKGEEHPFPVTLERKFNPLQKLTYFLAMYVGIPLLILSGTALLFPEITINKIFGVSGLVLTDIMHVTMGFLLSIFMVIHIYTCTLGARVTSLFWSMISGYHESEEH